MKKPIPSLCAAALLLGGCLEHAEYLTIAADGSVHVRISAKGGQRDLSEGSSIPEFGPWMAADEVTAAWLAGASRNARGEKSGAKLKVAVKATFARVEDLPQFYAPARDPYRSASLERTTSLRIESRGLRKIYIFERRYSSPGQGILDPMKTLEKEMPDGLEKVFDERGEPNDWSWSWIHRTLLTAHQELAAIYLREACLPLFLDEEDLLSTQKLTTILESSRERLARIFTIDRLQGIYHELLAMKNATPDQATNPFETLEREGRNAVRSALTATLETTGIDASMRNRALGTLEWWFAANDHTDDLGDESFSLRVTMPGKIIGGNADKILPGGQAYWKFDGKVLNDRDITLRVISLVE